MSSIDHIQHLASCGEDQENIHTRINNGHWKFEGFGVGGGGGGGAQ